MEKNGFAEYVIANVARERNKSGWSSDRKDFLIELFHGKDISMIKPEDLIEIIQKTPRSLGSCEQIITGNRTCPSEVLDFVAEENFATIEKSNNFSFRKDNFAEGVYGKMTSGVRGIALFEIIENAPNKLLKKIFFKIKNSKKLSTGDKNSLLDYMVVRDKKVPADLLEKLLLSEFANVSAGAEIRLEKIGRQIKYKANELAHYKSLEDGVLCKQCTDYEGYSTVVIKERPPEEENVLDKELGVKHVFVREEGRFSFFMLTSKEKGVFVKQQPFPYDNRRQCYLEVFDIDRNPTGRDILADRTDLDIVFV